MAKPLAEPSTRFGRWCRAQLRAHPVWSSLALGLWLTVSFTVLRVATGETDLVRTFLVTAVFGMTLGIAMQVTTWHHDRASWPGTQSTDTDEHRV